MLVSLSSTTPWPLLPVVSPAGLVVSVQSTEQLELDNDDEKDDIPRMVEWTNKHNHSTRMEDAPTTTMNQDDSDPDAHSEVSSLASTGSVVPTTRVVLTHKEQYQRLYAIAPRQPSKLPHPAALLPPPGPFCRADLAPYPWPPRPAAVTALDQQQEEQDETNGPQTSLAVAKESGSSSS